ncbi:DsrE family protein [Sulfurisphaera javensis]|uniref:DsrE family protein n=1 Tax=Sulfurisphaera javensis TaxID=2049879 RepID=A0AAT9GQD2_9CREN
MVDYAIMMVSGDNEKIYMGIITAIGLVSGGNKVYMFFTMDALKALTPESEKIILTNAKPLKYYIDNLLELGGEDVKIVACEFGMKVKGIKEEQFIYPVKPSGVSEFALKANEAKGVLIF